MSVSPGRPLHYRRRDSGRPEARLLCETGLDPDAPTSGPTASSTLSFRFHHPGLLISTIKKQVPRRRNRERAAGVGASLETRKWAELRGGACGSPALCPIQTARRF